MKQLFKMAFSGSALMCACVAAQAATYELSFKQLSTDQVIDLIVTTATPADSLQTITSLRGSVGNVAIAGLDTNNNATYLFQTANPYFGSNGIAFIDSIGTLWNLSAPAGTQSFLLASSKGVSVTGSSDVTLLAPATAVSEPDSLAMMAVGLGVISALARRRRPH